MSIWDKSSYLDLTASGVTDATTVAQAYGLTDPHTMTGTTTIALVLPRMADPTALLSSTYAQREAVLNGLTPDQVGALYGADPASYGALKAYLAATPGVALTDPSTNISSAASRTIWIDVTSQGFQTLFGTPLLNSERHFAYWNGTLSPNAHLASLTGLWLQQPDGPPAPTPQQTAAVTLADGPQGVANTAGGGYAVANTVAPHEKLFPNEIAQSYHFPMQITGNATLATPKIGLIEPGFGNAVAAGKDANQLLLDYRAKAGVTGSGTLSGGLVEAPVNVPTSDERSLDVGVVATAAPNSNIITYAGNGHTYSAFQEAIWDGTRPGIVSSSFSTSARPAAGSPFDAAIKELFTDAALNNITVFAPGGDGGSSAEVGTGGTAIIPGYASPYVTMVGGTSTSNQNQVQAAGAAATGGGPNINAGVAALLARAIAGNVEALQILVEGGMRLRPTADTNVGHLLQTAWNEYNFNAVTSVLSPSYAQNASTGGGIDPNLAEPGFQKDAGIDTRALQEAAGITPAATALRGMPDVSALAGGNMSYNVPKADLTGLQGNGGTSAATPLWAALTAQIQAVFTDQGLPTLGVINDLLYQAAAISPAAFDDVQYGSNTSSFYKDPSGTVTAHLKKNSDGSTATEQVTPTGIGYTAGRGYDLVSGLGTPNGILLARAMTQIAQMQINAPDGLGVTDATGASATAQALILQPHLTSGFTGSIGAGGISFTPGSTGSGLGWSARIAQQVLQSRFDGGLVQAIAGQSQAASTQFVAGGGQSLAVTIGGGAAIPVAQSDTSQFGFVTYAAGGETVTLARPLAVAHTYGGQDDTNAILRIRQTTADDDRISFYRVDDLVGTIDGIAPGMAGYAEAAAARDYLTPQGNADLNGQGAGHFRQTTLTNVDEGDIIGFRVHDLTSGKVSWGLAAQNVDGANDLWSYGANTWGFNDGSAGGDGYDSLVFQLDFTSNAGSGLLAFDSTPACFVAGTRIMTPAGERAVEQLAIGDLVTTAAGRHRAIRWIGRRAYAGRFLASQPGLHPVRFRQGSLGEDALGQALPWRDLLVSPEHAMLIDGVLVPARCLLDGGAVVQEAGLAEVAYLHIELDSHDAILAEGTASETFVDDRSRGIFHNAAEHAALYPEARPIPARFCAERLREGEALAALRQRLANRRLALGPLIGRLEQADAAAITGWAFDGRNTDRPQRLCITADGVVLGTVTAEQERPDLRRAGYGDGRLGFRFVPHPALPPGTHAIRVCRAEDGALLGEAAMVVPAAPAATPPRRPASATPLRGFLDEASRIEVQGWAWDPAAPHEPVALQVIADGRLVAVGTANRFRRDLRTAGIGNGWHGFRIAIPGGLSPLSRHVIQVRRQADGAALPGDPMVLEAAECFGPELEQAIHQVVGAVPDGPDGERVLSFILAQAERLRRRQDGAGGDAPDASYALAARALIIDDHLPRAGRDAGSQAVLGHARALQALGFHVSIAAAEQAEGQDADAAEAMLRAAGITPYAPPRHASVEEVLRRHAGRFGLVYLHRHGPASRYLGLVRAHQPAARVVYSVADLHHVRLGRQAALSGDAGLLADSRRLRVSEFAAAAQADAVITHSTAEAAMLRRALPEASIHCVGWAPSPRRVTIPFARRNGVAFLGCFTHAPNEDAALWLVHDVMPLVWQENPAITCTLAGSAMPAAVQRLAGPRLVVAGQVPDLHALFSRIRLTVAPLRFGAGLKGKVLDSLAAGLPCALTPIAAEGLPLPPSLGPLVGRSAAELAAIILRLHDRPEENRRAAAAGRRMMARHYSEDAVIEGMRAALACPLSPAAPRAAAMP